MKKVFLFFGLLLFLSGCGKYNEVDLVNDLAKKVEKSNSYHLSGTLEIFRNEDKYSYAVDSSYMKGDYFKVDLVNQNNNHKQIILKNKDGVFVMTLKSLQFK